MTTHIISHATLPHEGVFSACAILPEHAAVYIAAAIDCDEASWHIMHRTCADVIERLTGRKIPSKLLRHAEQSNIEMSIADLLICVRLNRRGRERVKGEPRAELGTEHYDFLRVERIG